MFLARESIAVCMFIASHISACRSVAHLGQKVRLVIAVLCSILHLWELGRDHLMLCNTVSAHSPEYHL